MKNKKTFASNLFSTICFLLALLLFMVLSAPSYAQTATPEPTPTPLATDVENIVPGVVNLTFAQLGKESIDMVSPAIEKVSFSLPYRWVVDQRNSTIELNFDVHQSEPRVPFTDGTPDATSVASDSIDTVFTVFLDDVPVTSFTPSPGINQTLQLPIPFNTFSDPEKTDHQIKFVLQRYDCLNTTPTRVVIHNDSNIQLAYEEKSPVPNLADFPQPLLQGGFLPESLLIVIPDDFNETDLAAAASVAATIGREIDRPVALSVAKASVLTETQLLTQSVIAIGSPERNVFIADLYARNLLPTTLNEEGVIVGADGQLVPQDYAVLQEIISEKNSDYAYLVLTGGSDDAVTQGVRALSAHTPIFGLRSDIAILENVQDAEFPDDINSSEIIPLSEIDFFDTIWTGIEQHTSTVYFYIPANWDIRDGTSLTISYVPASGLDASLSNLRVNLNNRLIGDVSLANSELGEQQVTIPFPEYVLEVGDYNDLTFVADLASDDPCPSLDAPTIWLRLSGEGHIALPHDLILDSRLASAQEVPFVVKPDMSDLLFVLPELPTETDLYSMVSLAQMMGDNEIGTNYRPVVKLGQVEADESLAPYQVIAIGRPSTNALTTAVNEQLPQPFLLGEDTLGETVGDLNYHLPLGFDLGVIQTIPASWNSKRPFIVISGTTDKGLQWATDALTMGQLNGELDGNLTFIQESFVETFDLLEAKQADDLAAMSTVIPNSVQVDVAAGEPTQDTAVAQPDQKATLTPSAADTFPDKYQPPEAMINSTSNIVVGLIGLGVLVLIGGTIFTWLKSRRDKNRQS